MPIRSAGSKLYCDFAAEGSGEPVEIEYLNLQGPDMKYMTKKVTNNNSDGSEFFGTLLEVGTVKVKKTFDPSDAVDSALLTLFLSGLAATWSEVFTDDSDTTVTYSGIIVSFPFGDLGPEGSPEVEFEIQVTGGVTIE